MLGDKQIEKGETALFTRELLEDITEKAKQRAAKNEKPNLDITSY